MRLFNGLDLLNEKGLRAPLSPSLRKCMLRRHRRTERRTVSPLTRLALWIAWALAGVALLWGTHEWFMRSVISSFPHH